MNTIVDLMREKAFTHLMGNETFSEPWKKWKPTIDKLIGSPPAIDKVIDLGDHLHDIFKSTGVTGRDQAMLSGGGNAWESLVCWYLNYCLQGSRTVVFKHNRQLVPPAVMSAITVNYGSFASNSESDLIAIVVPPEESYITEYKGRDAFNDFKALASQDLHKYEIAVIQCKTNWNDNAQIPMLWDLVYASKGFQNLNVNIGNSGYSIKEIKRFTYSFVTVPTSKGPFNPDSVRVQRVRNLTGGNYWGLPSKNGVANSLKEIFQRNFDSGFNSGFRQDLDKALKRQ